MINMAPCHVRAQILANWIARMRADSPLSKPVPLVASAPTKRYRDRIVAQPHKFTPVSEGV